MKILICADGSRVNRNAIEFGALIAAAVEAEVTVMHVVEEGVDKSKKIFNDAKEILKSAGVGDIKTKKLRGRPDIKIINHAKKYTYDLVIMGSQGMKSLKTFIFGDVAVRVIEYIQTPILVVGVGRKKLRKILFCTGGSVFAENAIKFGSSIAKKANAKATVLHVIPNIPAMYRGIGMNGGLKQFLKCDTPECMAVERAARILEKQGIESDVRLAHGLPSEEILNLLEEGDYDLVMMGSHGMTSPTRFLLGDVAYKVVKHSKIPCLLVK